MQMCNHWKQREKRNNRCEHAFFREQITKQKHINILRQFKVKSREDSSVLGICNAATLVPLEGMEKLRAMGWGGIGSGDAALDATKLFAVETFWPLDTNGLEWPTRPKSLELEGKLVRGLGNSWTGVGSTYELNFRDKDGCICLRFSLVSGLLSAKSGADWLPALTFKEKNSL